MIWAPIPAAAGSKVPVAVLTPAPVYVPPGGIPSLSWMILAVGIVMESVHIIKEMNGLGFTRMEKAGDEVPFPQLFTPLTVRLAVPEKADDQSIVMEFVFPVMVPAVPGTSVQL
jgi:hypothetical protein